MTSRKISLIKTNMARENESVPAKQITWNVGRTREVPVTHEQSVLATSQITEIGNVVYCSMNSKPNMFYLLKALTSLYFRTFRFAFEMYGERRLERGMKAVIDRREAWKEGERGGKDGRREIEERGMKEVADRRAAWKEGKRKGRDGERKGWKDRERVDSLSPLIT